MKDLQVNGFGPSGVIVCAFFTFAAMACAGTYSGGSGTSMNPYKISTVADWGELTNTSADWGKNFILLNDIDFGGVSLTPVAADTNSNSEGFQGTPFSGIFDGKGHVLRNATFNFPKADFVGLFGYCGTGSHIFDLGVDAVTLSGRSFAGAFCGNNAGALSRCSATITLTGGIDSIYFGGICGANDRGGIVSDCHTAVIITGGIHAGWFGGICGTNYSTVDHCSATGEILGIGGLGGLCGWNNEGTISNSFADVNITGGKGSNDLGGLCGFQFPGLIRGSFASGQVTGGDNSSCIGGLCGNNFAGGGITACYATGPVTGGVNSSCLGGLCGRMGDGFHGPSDISDSCATGPVTGGAGSKVIGGLCGSLGYGTITNSMATGSVSGGSGLGGLCGANYDTISNCYSTGLVSGLSSLGGLCGTNPSGKIYTSFWDTETSGQATSTGGIGKTTVEMKTQATFTDAGWDLLYDWRMSENDYPYPAWVNPGAYSGGSGTEGDPYQIATISDWNTLIVDIRNHDKNFVLAHDLDFSGSSIRPVASTGSSFQGVFNGQGHVLRNAIISMPDRAFVGLFARLDTGAVIRNLRADNVDIAGRYCVGGICGNISGTIENCYFSGNVIGEESVGGLCGQNNQGRISSCFTAGSVGATSWWVGGLCGLGGGCLIQDCYSTTTVNGSNLYAGGLLGGMAQGKVLRCFSAGKVTGSSSAGGLCGFADPGGDYEDSGNFWDIQSSGMTTSAMGTGKTTAEMKAIATFTGAGWDFVGEWFNGDEDNWRMCGEGVSYPRLSWEFSGGGDMDCPDGVGLEDLLYLAGRWMKTTAMGAADGNGDGKVDMIDLAIVSEHWMK